MSNKFSEQFLMNYISKEWILLLREHTKLKKFSKNERIIKEGDKVTGIYLINHGKVKISSYYDVENERILRLSSAGDIVGHRGLSSICYPISATALTDVVATFIPIDFFKLLFRSNPDLALYIINFFSNDLKASEECMKNMIHNDVIIRAAIIICMLIDAFGYDARGSKKLSFTLARKDMANMAVTTYESITRNLAKLEDMKLIKIKEKEIYVLNEKQLRNLVAMKK